MILPPPNLPIPDNPDLLTHSIAFCVGGTVVMILVCILFQLHDKKQ